MRIGLFVAGLLILLAGCTNSSSTLSLPPPSPSPSPSPTGMCDPSLWQNIYHPQRLHVVDSCKTITGLVESVRHESDGDVHLQVKLPADEQSLLNSVNMAKQDGDLVVEIICAGTVTQADALSACAGYRNLVPIPSVGDHVSITGTYVLDADHGWMEIHPVTSLTVLKSVWIGSPSPSPSHITSQASSSPAPTGCTPKTPSGGCYELMRLTFGVKYVTINTP